MSGIKMRTAVADGVATIRTLIQHPMETGQRKDESGRRIPAHFIEELVCEHAGRVVLTCNWGTGISKNPYLAFKIKNVKAGDPIRLSWTDNLGQHDSITTVLE